MMKYKYISIIFIATIALAIMYNNTNNNNMTTSSSSLTTIDKLNASLDKLGHTIERDTNLIEQLFDSIKTGGG